MTTFEVLFLFCCCLGNRRPSDVRELRKGDSDVNENVTLKYDLTFSILLRCYLNQLNFSNVAELSGS